MASEASTPGWAKSGRDSTIPIGILTNSSYKTRAADREALVGRAAYDMRCDECHQWKDPRAFLQVSMYQAVRSSTCDECMLRLAVSNERLQKLKAVARRYYRMKDNTMTFSDIFRRIEGTCWYCGRKSTAREVNGLDRMDSRVGHTGDNCVACCKFCNLSKNRMDPWSFVQRCEAIAKGVGALDEAYARAWPPMRQWEDGAVTEDETAIYGETSLDDDETTTGDSVDDMRWSDSTGGDPDSATEAAGTAPTDAEPAAELAPKGVAPLPPNCKPYKTWVVAWNRRRRRPTVTEAQYGELMASPCAYCRRTGRVSIVLDLRKSPVNVKNVRALCVECSNMRTKISHRKFMSMCQAIAERKHVREEFFAHTQNVRALSKVGTLTDEQTSKAQLASEQRIAGAQDEAGYDSPSVESSVTYDDDDEDESLGPEDEELERVGETSPLPSLDAGEGGLPGRVASPGATPNASEKRDKNAASQESGDGFKDSVCEFPDTPEREEAEARWNPTTPTPPRPPVRNPLATPNSSQTPTTVLSDATPVRPASSTGSSSQRSADASAVPLSSDATPVRPASSTGSSSRRSADASTAPPPSPASSFSSMAVSGAAFAAKTFTWCLTPVVRGVTAATARSRDAGADTTRRQLFNDAPTVCGVADGSDGEAPSRAVHVLSSVLSVVVVVFKTLVWCLALIVRGIAAAVARSLAAGAGATPQRLANGASAGRRTAAREICSREGSDAGRRGSQARVAREDDEALSEAYDAPVESASSSSSPQSRVSSFVRHKAVDSLLLAAAGEPSSASTRQQRRHNRGVVLASPSPSCGSIDVPSTERTRCAGAPQLDEEGRFTYSRGGWLVVSECSKIAARGFRCNACTRAFTNGAANMDCRGYYVVHHERADDGVVERKRHDHVCTTPGAVAASSRGRHAGRCSHCIKLVQDAALP